MAFFLLVILVTDPNRAAEYLADFDEKAVTRKDLASQHHVTMGDARILRAPDCGGKWEYFLPRIACIKSNCTDSERFVWVDIETPDCFPRQFVPFSFLEVPKDDTCGLTPKSVNRNHA